jgi:hypothetical protein
MKNISYGISLAACGSAPRGGIKNLPRCFELLELPGHMLDDINLFRQLSMSTVGAVNITELIDNSVSASIAMQSDKIILDFKRQISKRLGAMNFPVDSVIMDMGLAEAFENEECKNKLAGLIRELAMSLHILDVKLALPLRIPGCDDTFMRFCLDFKRELMTPWLCFSADIHPHELGKTFVPEEILRWIRFDIAVLRVHYEPETGNRLVDKAIKPWLEFLSESAFEGKVVFSPHCSDMNTWISETENIAELISGLGG